MRTSDRSSGRSYDVVLFGATGFTGGLTAEYLARHAPEGCRGRWPGATGPSSRRCVTRLAAIDPALSELALLIADSGDAESLRKVAASTRVLISTVGPYVTYGEPLVAACAAEGTDYLDLTGEPEFVDRMYLAHHETALASGARLVHACGFDSIPHDLGARFTVEQLPEGEPVRLRGVVRAGAQFSGGTFHSALNAFSRAAQMREAAKERRAKEGRPEGGRRSRAVAGKPHRDAGLGYWLVPLPTIDPFVVQRSGAALERYGPDFRYSHYAGVKTLRYLAGGAVGMGGLLLAAQVPALRKLLLDRVKPGDGPSASAGAPGRGSPSTSSARPGVRRSAPGSPAATRATTRRRRCWPSPRSAWPSTTTR